jgi:hypothetical protein
MNAFVLIMIAIVTTIEYPLQMGYLPSFAKLAPEVLSAMALLFVLAYGLRDRAVLVRPVYWLIFGLAATTMVCGVLANSVGVGPVIAGMRRFLRPVPLFFIPAVYAFSDRQIRKQLLLLLLLCLPQFPIALDQRMTRLAAGGGTGDTTVGTLGGSGLLSIFLVCAACVLTAAFLRKRIKLLMFVPLFLLVLLPTMINETKATVVFLPIGLLVTFIAGSQRGARMKNGVLACALLLMFAAIFIPIYDFYASQTKYTKPIMEFFTDENAFDQYMTKDASVGATTVRQTGRVDALKIPLREMARDPTHMVFGLGIGNASESSLGEQFNGEYFDKFAPFVRSAASRFILEIGLLGLACVFLLDYLIYRDARVVADTDEGIIGMLAVGWTGVTMVIILATPYSVLDTSEAISYLFWYFSGVIAAHRARAPLRQAIANRQQRLAPAARDLRPQIALSKLQRH